MWDQPLIIGEYGSGKTTLAMKAALSYFRKGRAVFSNAACLSGWWLDYEEMDGPSASCPSMRSCRSTKAAPPCRPGWVPAWPRRRWGDDLNSRKRNAKVFTMSAQDWEVAPAIQRERRQVGMPVSKEKLTISL